MTNLLRWLALAALLLLASRARGQDDLPEMPAPENPEPFVIPGFSPDPPAAAPAPPPIAPAAPGVPFTGGRVFLAPLQSLDPALNAEAARLTQILQIHMLGRYPLVTIDAVPPWPDYSALIYLMGCPPGQYPGCALVCGNRVGAEWTVGGTVTRNPHGVTVNLTFLENLSAREVLTFGVALHGTNDRDLLRAVDTILDRSLAGAFAAVDLRRAETDPVERAKLEAARNQVIASSLAELEREEGAVQREILQVEEPGKIDRQALSAEYAEREEVKPWEKVGLREGAFVRYKNSGLPLQDWRRLSRGRTLEIIARAALGAGSGPFGQTFDGRYAIGDDLERAEVQQYQFLSAAPHAHLDLELGLGIAPFLDLTGHYTLRNSPFVYVINQERVGSPVVVPGPRRLASSSWQAGGRIAIVPFPVRSVRPAAHVGFSYWQGTTWDAIIEPVEDLEPMEAMNQLLVQVGPGVEITAGRHVHLFARVLADMAVGGQRLAILQEGGSSLQERADTSAFRPSSAGVTAQAGLVLRLRLRPEPDDGATGPRTRFEEEEP